MLASAAGLCEILGPPMSLASSTIIMEDAWRAPGFGAFAGPADFGPSTGAHLLVASPGSIPGSIEQHVLLGSHDTAGMLSGSLAVGSYGAALPGSFGGTGGALGGSVGASWVPSSDYSGRRDTLGVGSHFDLSSLGGSVHGGSAHGGSAHGGSTHGCAAAVILHGRSLGTFPSTVEALQASLDSSAGHHAASVEELLRCARLRGS